MNSVVKAHEELIKTYESLGMLDYAEKERKRLKTVKEYYNIKNNQPVQLEINFD